MKQIIACLILGTALIAPGTACAAAQSDFDAKTTQELMNLCTASPNDPLYTAAQNFCHGFLVGAYQYYVAENAGPEGKRMVCFPEPPPTRNEAIGMFIDWAKGHPQFMGEKPVETEFRFLMEKWPCKK